MGHQNAHSFSVLLPRSYRSEVQDFKLGSKEARGPRLEQKGSTGNSGLVLGLSALAPSLATPVLLWCTQLLSLWLALFGLFCSLSEGQPREGPSFAHNWCSAWHTVGPQHTLVD